MVVVLARLAANSREGLFRTKINHQLMGVRCFIRAPGSVPESDGLLIKYIIRRAALPDQSNLPGWGSWRFQNR